MNTLKQLDTWHKTRSGFLVFGVVELVLGYLFFSLAVNSGSLWQGALSATLFIGGLRSFFLLAMKVKNRT